MNSTTRNLFVEEYYRKEAEKKKNKHKAEKFNSFKSLKSKAGISYDKKYEFKNKVVNNLESGAWTLKHVQYLNDNKFKYNLDLQEINIFLNIHYQYVYNMAMEDGIVTDLEANQLSTIHSYMNQVNPVVNRYTIENVKQRITKLTRQVEKTNGVQENWDIEANYKKDINSIYNMSRVYRPKLTPYENYNF